MYLYLGQETVISTGDIVGIFDLDNTSVSHLTRSYLSVAQKSGHVVVVSPDLPKSFVVWEKNGETKVYLSQISTATLKKRAGNLKGMNSL